MIVNRQALQSIFLSFKTIYQKAFQNTAPSYKKISTVVPSSAKSEEYKWLGKLPKMREWVGARVIQNLGAYDYTIKNKDFEATVALDRNDIDDDQIGVYQPIIQSLGQAAANHPDELCYELLVKGFEEKCYDGKNFFDTSHKEGKSGVQSNKGTKVLTPESYGEARANQMSLKDDQGNPLVIIPGLLVVPPQLEGAAKKILMADEINGETNIYKGSAELHVEPRLAGHPTKWFLLDVSKPIKPIVFQERKKPEFVSKTKLDDDNVFFEKQFVYGVDSRGNVGFSLWQLAYGSTGETPVQ